ncbi:glycyl-tRNA synthetase, beta subunit [Ammonifex degensii KC4]|uniref:Glycine--tRNA ligase beta subunit n=1 Tax=Ammonifex degensii (strain DSM 10501 / KC4) TaxID=429009 RepID=C9R946_AMMDK|nr:glycine--tRNA ligase subunit beta [Ammonifex degensii]ACX52825.1 glycyl-tRNA synthetase, beta subunit [Ammonifex degensii KC4]
MRDFLLEIGTEEMPARLLSSILEDLREKAQELLREARLSYREIKTFGTPRRLVLLVKGLAEKQERLVREVKGPARRVAFDEEGKPTKAALGFARSQGVKVEDLVVRLVGDTEYVYAVKEEEGRPTPEVLRELCPRLITSLSFPRSMRWGDKKISFIRPIRWLLALYGEEVIPFELDGLKAGNVTRGHRFLSSAPVTVPSPEAYFQLMAENFVVVDPEERKKLILSQLEELAAREGGKVEADPELLEEVANLVEYATAFCGSFSPEFLRLPEAVLVTTMKEHQRYFPLRDKEGKLLPRFLAVHSSSPAHTEGIRKGNERVLKARLADASFFYREDLARPLADRVEGLKRVVYLEDLGTLYDKTLRLQELVAYLGNELGVDDATRKILARAAYLAKADLLTHMVYEFPELQGVMGREYALASGEDPAVAEALYEQYLPRFAGDALPQTMPGRILGLADKVDNLVGCFGLGLIPTGSQDPYALRRQALGIIHIITSASLSLSLSRLWEKAYQAYRGRLRLGLEEVLGSLRDFFAQRLRALWGEKIRAEVIEAVLAVGFDDLNRAFLKTQALAAFCQDPAFPLLHTAYLRAVNILKGNLPEEKPDPSLFVHPAEQELYDTLVGLEEEVAPDLKRGDYFAVLQKLTRLHDPVARFFDGVLVMDENPALRANRLALLAWIVRLVREVGDISCIPVT